MASKSLTFDIFGRDKTASKAIKGVGSAADGLGSKLGKLASAIGLAFAAKQIVDFGVDSVKAFAEAQQAQAKLSDAFDRFPKLADTNIQALGKLNSALAKKTRFDDDATSAGQATLAQYGLTGAQIVKLTPLMQDYAAKTGRDLPAAAEVLGKAMLGQGKALKDVGIKFTDTKTLAGNFDEVMGSLSAKVSGFAEKDGMTAAGKLEILKNRFGEVQEKVGEALIPALEGLAKFTEETVMPALEGFAAWFAEDGVPAMQGFADWVNSTGIPALRDFTTWFGTVQRASYDFGYAMAENLAPAQQALYDFGYNSGPAFARVNDDFYTLGYNAGEFVTKFAGSWAAAEKILYDFGYNTAGMFADMGTNMNNAGVSIGANLADGILRSMSSVKHALNVAIGYINSSIGRVNVIGGALGAATGGKAGFHIDTIPMLAKGGTALTSGMALVGERGPELLHLPKGASVIPLDRVGNTSAGANGGVNNWNISTPANPLAVAQAVWRRQNALGAV